MEELRVGHVTKCMSYYLSTPSIILTPDVMTLVGAAVIIASGLYTAHRERIVARQRLMRLG